MHSLKSFHIRNLITLSHKKLLIISAIITISYNEYLINYFQSFKWPDIDCVTVNCTRILFVADPQLLGDTFDKNWYSWAAKVDNDMHIKNTFTLVYTHVKPDVICFLGDIFDEGSVASHTEYNKYYARFVDVFRVAMTEKSVGKFFVSGDNDIGGEGGMYCLLVKYKVEITRFIRT